MFEGDPIPNGVNGHVNGHAEGVNGHVNGVNGHAEPGIQPKPSLRLSFTEYKRLSNLLVLHLRKAEEGKRRSSVLLPASKCIIKISPFHWFILCSRGRGRTEEKRGGELVLEGDRVRDRL